MAKNDYEILGIPEDSDKKIVKDRYDLLIKQYKYKTDEYGTTNEDLTYYNSITEAYDRIMGITHDYSDPNPTSIIPYPIRKLWYKIDTKLDGYQMLIMGVFLILCLIGIITYQIVSEPDYDIKVKFVGAFESMNTVQVCDSIEESLDTDMELSASFFTVIEDVTIMDNHAKNSAVQFRSQTMAGALDVILIDVENLDVYIDDYMFLNLNDYVDKIKSNPETAKLLDGVQFYTYENKGETDRLAGGIYGIYVTDTPVFSQESTGLMWGYDEERRTMIATVCRTSENQDKALDFITMLLEVNS